MMTDHKAGYRYSVVRDTGGPGHADVALVRFSGPHGVLEHLLHRHASDIVVLARRSFRPMFELAQMEAYAAQLELLAKHANEGKFGCFVETEQRDGGIVRVVLYERWFDGQRLHMEELARRDFDATDPDAVASSAGFLTELQIRAAERNEQREAGYLEADVEGRGRLEQATEREQAARELAQILKSHNTPADT